MRRGAEKTDLLTIPHFERSEQNNRAAIADVLAVAKPRALFRSGRAALLGSYGARVEPAQRCENNFTSERRWASRIFPVSRRSPARGELMPGSFCEGEK